MSMSDQHWWGGKRVGGGAQFINDPGYLWVKAMEHSAGFSWSWRLCEHSIDS